MIAVLVYAPVGVVTALPAIFNVLTALIALAVKLPLKLPVAADNARAPTRLGGGDSAIAPEQRHGHPSGG